MVKEIGPPLPPIGNFVTLTVEIVSKEPHGAVGSLSSSKPRDGG